MPPVCSATAGEANLPPEPPPEEEDPEFQAKAKEFKAWLEDWRRTLRNTIGRRDYQIQLGLASRRVSAPDDDDSEEDE